MIDGKKICNLSVDITELLHNDLLNFPMSVNEKDGEILKIPRFAKHKGLVFKLHNNNVSLNGSIHTYFNNGKHNYNDFFYSNLLDAIIDLCSNFNIDPNRTILNNLEFGVNIKTPFPPEQFLKSIVNYKRTPFHQFNIKGAKGIECEMTDFYIKIYDKSKQHNRKDYILRFEIRVIKMKYFTEKGIKIKYLSDLLQKDLFLKLGGILITVFNELLFSDPSIVIKNLPPKDGLILSQGCNADFWESLNPKSKNFSGGNKDPEYKRLMKKYDRKRVLYINTLKKYSSSTMQNDVFLLIENKYKELANYDENLRGKLTDFLNSIENKNRGKLPYFKTPIETQEKGQTNILNIALDYPLTPVNKKGVCLFCEEEFMRRSKRHKFCSKKCKNDYTNPRLNPKNNLKKRIKKIESKAKLFADEEFITLTPEKLHLLNNPNSIYNQVKASL